ncbi:hypothetical protein [Catelliglobosispora koreensis]|nr:hypothetical protein [Catelliglobosispora koreensis]
MRNDQQIGARPGGMVDARVVGHMAKAVPGIAITSAQGDSGDCS